VLFTISPMSRAIGDTSVAVLDAQTGAHKVVVRNGSHALRSEGHLVCAVGNSLRHSVRRRPIGGDRAAGADTARYHRDRRQWTSYFDMQDGTLVYALRGSVKRPDD
jgi:hypothetical protein